jgi:hypothetical protein
MAYYKNVRGYPTFEFLLRDIFCTLKQLKQAKVDEKKVLLAL